MICETLFSVNVTVYVPLVKKPFPLIVIISPISAVCEDVVILVGNSFCCCGSVESSFEQEKVINKIVTRFKIFLIVYFVKCFYFVLILKSLYFSFSMFA
jgi:hypothetical protein